MLRSAVEMCEQKAADKQIALEMQCPDDLMIRANAPLLEQAVMNLIDNAIKYSAADATVRVSAGMEGEQVVIRVQDQGCGIAARHLPRLFERFYRVDRARSREMGGTGLGWPSSSTSSALTAGPCAWKAPSAAAAPSRSHLPCLPREAGCLTDF